LLKVAHLSDIHCRTLRYHQDYRRSFEDVHRHLSRERPDLVIVTGDVVHSKTQMSPELVSLLHTFFDTLIDVAPTRVILGNHDLNLGNLERRDAFSPVVASMADPRLKAYLTSGLSETFTKDGLDFSFWTFSLGDVPGYPTKELWNANPGVNIGLYHGPVHGCAVDSGWRMTGIERDVSSFDGLDYVMLGDIHKRQSFRNGTIAYAGSLIQQNFGEDTEKGFLIWELEKGAHEVKFQLVTGARKFYTVGIQNDLTLPDVTIPPDSHVRLTPPRQLTLAEQREVETRARRILTPHDVVTLPPEVDFTSADSEKDAVSVRTSQVRDTEVQDDLLKRYFSERALEQDVLDQVLSLNRSYQATVDQEETVVRNVRWQVEQMSWSNFFRYGTGNHIDFRKMGGLTGLFGPNDSGKSSLIDILTIGCFDSTTKKIPKNIHVINDQRADASLGMVIRSGEERFMIDKKVERVKSGGKRTAEEREWGRASTKLFRILPDGSKESMVGLSRSETERALRRRIGEFDDFLLTSLSAQANPLDVVACKETARREVLYRFFDLDFFSRKGELARKELNPLLDQLKMLEETDVESTLAAARSQLEALTSQEAALKERLSTVTAELSSAEAELAVVSSRLTGVSSTQSEIKSLDKRISELSAELSRGNEQLRSLDRELSRIDSSLISAQDAARLIHEEDLTDVSSLLREREEELRRVKSDIRQSSHELEGMKRDVRLLSDVPCGDAFPECKFLVNAFKSKSLISGVNSMLAALSKREGELAQEVAALSERDARYRKLSSSANSLGSLTELRTSTERSVVSVKQLVTRFEAEQKSISSRRDELVLSFDGSSLSEMVERRRQVERLRAALTEVHNGLSATQRNIGATQATIENREALLIRLNELRSRCNVLELFAEAMGKDGVPYAILKTLLPVLNHEINRVLSVAVAFQVTVEDDPTDGSIRFFVRDPDGGQRILELVGGAARFVTSIAIRVALFGLSTIPRCNLFVIDEGFGSLDPGRAEGVHRMLGYLRDVFDNVLVVSHLDVMRDVVDNTIEIGVDDEGCSHISVGERSVEDELDEELGRKT